MSSVNPGPGLIPVVTPPGVVVNAEGVPANGDVPTYVAATDSVSWQAGGGGGSQPLVRIPIAFNTPNILTGITLFTPQIGQVWLISASYISITTSFNGATPTLQLFSQGEPSGQYGSIGLIGTDTDAEGGGEIFTPPLAMNGQGIPTTNFRTDFFALSTPFDALIDDGSGGDPGMSQGAGEIVCVILGP